MVPITKSRGRVPHDRRGVLLLIVLSMLTLFLMLGASYLVVAIRARKVSKAYADKVVNSSAVGANASRLVDEAFLVIARGTPNTTIGYVGGGATGGDDLLGDKYGSAAGASIGGRIQSATRFDVNSTGFISITTNNLTPALPTGSVSELPGRVFTLTLPGLSVSTRILRATGAAASPTIVIPAGITASGASLSLADVEAAIARAAGLGGNHFRINGREFSGDPAVATDTNEPYDAFDSRNPLLTRIMPVAGGSPVVTQSLMNTTPIPAPAVPVSVDNDGDGVVDSQFISLGLPTFTDASGATIEPRAAVLVVDLDGRINLNVHDSTTDADTADPATGNSLYPPFLNTGEIPGDGVDNDSNGSVDDVYVWTPPATGLTLQSLPRGSSAGVASVSVRKADVLPPVAGNRPNGGAGSRKTTVQAGNRPLGGITSAKNKALPYDPTTTRPPPKIGGSEGRYGGSPTASNQPWDDANLTAADLPRPGRGSARAGYSPTEAYNDPSNDDCERWTVALTNDPSTARPGNRIADNYFTNPGRYGSPPDLKDRMRVWIDPSSGKPVYYKPFWDENGRTPGTPTITDNEVVDDPYEINLTRSGSRLNAARNPGSGGSKVDNPFTAADLEGLLRYFDPDSARLSRRLVVLTGTGSDASQNRLKLTTESWDTPAVTDTAWEQVVRSQFSSLLAAANPHDFFAPETIAGHKLDLNRPFHDPTLDEDANDNGVLDGGEDMNSNGILELAYNEPNDAIGRARRQQFAKHTYCLLVATAARNGLAMPMTADNARRLAQYAVNIVDFRDADSTMTLFRFDPGFRPGVSSWSPASSDFVWGCERPELLITETYAWHDRNTDDESVGGSGGSPGSVRDGSDTSFDQQRRPRGAFFIELTSPWGVPALEYDATTNSVRPNAAATGSRNPFEHFRADILPADLVSSEDTNGNGTLEGGEDINGNGRLDPGEDTNGDGLLDIGEDRNGNAILDLTQRNRLNTGIHLEKTVAATGDPVWRLVAVRGEVTNGTAFGSDPLSDATSNASRSIIDPAALGSASTVDRAFYFVRPPVALRNEIPGGVFWQGVPSGTPLTNGQFRVIGTNAPFDPGPGSAPANVAGIIGPGNKPATLSEPLTDSADDPYDVLMRTIQPTAVMTPDPLLGGIAASWNSAIPEPLDAYGPPARPFPGGADVRSAAFTDLAGRPILMINGTHENFAVMHLQRLADPSRPWDNVPGSLSYNPYVTVDVMPVDLNVVNSVNMKPANTPAPMTAALPAGNHDDPSAPTARTYGRAANPMLSIQRSGYGATANESDIWCRRVRATVSDLRDANAFLSEPAGPTAPNDLTANPIQERALPATPRHTLDGQVTGFRITNRGTGYTSSTAVTVTGGGGAGLIARAIVEAGRVVAIQVVNGGAGYRDPGLLTVSISGGGGSGATAVAIVGGKPPRWNSNGAYASLFWPNRPFANASELATVPYTSPFHLTQRHSIDSPTVSNSQKFFHLPGYFEDATPLAPWDAVTGRTSATAPSLLDFVAIPSRFAGLHATVPNTAANTAALTALGFNNYPVSQISHYREPGRINLNTIADPSAWRAMFGAVDVIGTISVSGTSDPDVNQAAPPPNLDRLPRWSEDLFGPTRNQGGGGPVAPTAPPASPALSLRGFFRNMPAPPLSTDDPNVAPVRMNPARTGGFRDSATSANDAHRNTARNVYFRYRTMSDLAERVTTRSNVFAVWVTVGYFDVTNPAAPVEVAPIVRNRGFYIFDRSIPVAYERGQDHNVRDAILLRRIIQ